jgi:hypothetical protein
MERPEVTAARLMLARWQYGTDASAARLAGLSEDQAHAVTGALLEIFMDMLVQLGRDPAEVARGLLDIFQAGMN